MKSLFESAIEQYAFIQESRKILLDYCGTLSPQDFVREHPCFGNGGNIRSLLVHVVNTYESWIAIRGLKKAIAFIEDNAIRDVNDIRMVFKAVDDHVLEFLKLIEVGGIITYVKEGKTREESPFRLFSHVITHEFHHKGQILSLSRCLGYVPVDTDIML